MTNIDADDPGARVRAIMALADGGNLDTATITSLLRALEAEQPMVRRASLDMLGTLSEHGRLVPPREAIAKALDLSLDPEPLVRAEACASLALFPVSSDTDREQRFVHLGGRLNDDEAGVRQEAAAALGDLAPLPAPIRTALAGLFSDADPVVRFEAAFALASTKDPRARVELETHLYTRALRADAVRALGRLGDPAARPAIRRAYDRWFVPHFDRMGAWAVLAHLGETEAKARLLKQLKAWNFDARIYACSLVGEWEIADGAGALRNLSERPAELAREAAIQALIALSRPEDRVRFEAWANDPTLDDALRAAALERARGLRNQSANRS